jgi:oligopeptide/dipeptide ABC transporter ATP-binding protein
MGGKYHSERIAVLGVEDLSVVFYTPAGTVRAVDGVSFEIWKKEIFGLVGESGCGKSTTALSIARLIQPPGEIVGGKVIFKGTDLLKVGPREMREIRGKGISMIFQEPMTSLNPVYKVGEQIVETIMLHQNTDKKEAQRKAIEMLKEVRIADPERVFEQYPHQLSGGMLQRAMIAIALSCAPDILIADEPTTALDVTIQAQILALIRELIRKIGTSVLLITHDLGVVAETCERVAVMYAGKIVEASQVEAIFDEPKHPYTKLLLETIPTFRGKKKEFLPTIEGRVPSLIRPPPGCRFHPRCPFAQPICAEKLPDLDEKGRGHYVACHFAE